MASFLQNLAIGAGQGAGTGLLLQGQNELKQAETLQKDMLSEKAAKAKALRDQHLQELKGQQSLAVQTQQDNAAMDRLKYKTENTPKTVAGKGIDPNKVIDAEWKRAQNLFVTEQQQADGTAKPAFDKQSFAEFMVEYEANPQQFTTKDGVLLPPVQAAAIWQKTKPQRAEQAEQRKKQEAVLKHWESMPPDKAAIKYEALSPDARDSISKLLRSNGNDKLAELLEKHAQETEKAKQARPQQKPTYAPTTPEDQRSFAGDVVAGIKDTFGIKDTKPENDTSTLPGKKKLAQPYIDGYAKNPQAVVDQLRAMSAPQRQSVIAAIKPFKPQIAKALMRSMATK